MRRVVRIVNGAGVALAPKAHLPFCEASTHGAPAFLLIGLDDPREGGGSVYTSRCLPILSGVGGVAVRSRRGTWYTNRCHAPPQPHPNPISTPPQPHPNPTYFSLQRTPTSRPSAHLLLTPAARHRPT